MFDQIERWYDMHRSTAPTPRKQWPVSVIVRGFASLNAFATVHLLLTSLHPHR
ncbi:hypothetical protein RB10998 [Rhodopirellula baltica SH 1]|uniref:Uncharacterized protein n=1 Tax=Rhodopirellula baltica (strain DSM 10527 / NCIMB 13988 / SH1) TaxID=243090 RepID=Q7UJX2_RHOBA|nr:hypothetical protein RB10998 [Rhodopirellula baltica SH 1]